MPLFVVLFLKINQLSINGKISLINWTWTLQPTVSLKSLTRSIAYLYSSIRYTFIVRHLSQGLSGLKLHVPPAVLSRSSWRLSMCTQSVKIFYSLFFIYQLKYFKLPIVKILKLSDQTNKFLYVFNWYLPFLLDILDHDCQFNSNLDSSRRSFSTRSWNGSQAFYRHALMLHLQWHISFKYL